MEDVKIKQVVRNIYKVDYTKLNLQDGDELITEDGQSDFVNLFKKYDINNGIIITPSGYERGLCFKTSGGVYNNPVWLPDIVSFNFNIYGLKRNGVYKLTVIARNTGDNNIITSNRELKVTSSDNEGLISADLKHVVVEKEYHAIFRSVGNEITLFFRLGKIFLKDIILDEIELQETETEKGTDIEEHQEVSDQISEGKIALAAYGIFDMSLMDTNEEARYAQLTRYSGRGLNLYYDKVNKSYTLERDNREDVLDASFINANYFIEMNFNKLVNKGYFLNYDITESVNDISPNTLKQGFIRFQFSDKDGNAVEHKATDGKIYIFIRKII